MDIKIAGPSGEVIVMIGAEYDSGYYDFRQWSATLDEFQLNGITYEMVYKYTDGKGISICRRTGV